MTGFGVTRSEVRSSPLFGNFGEVSIRPRISIYPTLTTIDTKLTSTDTRMPFPDPYTSPIMSKPRNDQYRPVDTDMHKNDSDNADCASNDKESMFMLEAGSPLTSIAWDEWMGGPHPSDSPRHSEQASRPEALKIWWVIGSWMHRERLTWLAE